MTITQRIFAIIISTMFIIFIVRMIRQRKLDIKYSVIWFITGLVILSLAISYRVLLFISSFIGAVNPITTLVIFGLFFVLMVNIHFSVQFSKMSRQITRLVQELAILKADFYELSQAQRDNQQRQQVDDSQQPGQ